MHEPLEAFLTLGRAELKCSRPGVMRPLAWLAGLEAACVAAACWWGAALMILAWLVMLFALTALVHLAVFVYFAFRDPDRLRSESYTLTRLDAGKGAEDGGARAATLAPDRIASTALVGHDGA